MASVLPGGNGRRPPSRAGEAGEGEAAGSVCRVGGNGTEPVHHRSRRSPVDGSDGVAGRCPSIPPASPVSDRQRRRAWVWPSRTDAALIMLLALVALVGPVTIVSGRYPSMRYHARALFCRKTITGAIAHAAPVARSAFPPDCQGRAAAGHCTASGALRVPGGSAAGARPGAVAHALARSLNVLGVCYAALDRHAEALDAYEAAVRTLLPVFQRLPAAFANQMAYSVWDYVTACQRLGRTPDAAVLAAVQQHLE